MAKAAHKSSKNPQSAESIFGRVFRVTALNNLLPIVFQKSAAGTQTLPEIFGSFPRFLETTDVAPLVGCFRIQISLSLANLAVRRLEADWAKNTAATAGGFPQIVPYC